ncbi:homoserine kinase [Peptostreptococcus equinus]|uniref:Homoserine kinase n=1 Tax=Peptostreptococcus equinus TaxID=3003601 RepID=A0ABY7JMX0_9FIRM|nr:homoserine kinase [Peptostreptococcus sp. CBA3647]WAW14713.1 homoserine kinase [Peptostreptococcus sp. CBA3647]
MYRIHVPATTANLGPGFDSLGMALSQYSIFEIEEADQVEILIEGLEAEKLSIENNLVINSMNRLFDYIGKYPKGYKLKTINHIPLARGMGSSAAAIIGGLLCANALMGNPLDRNAILKLATEIEGHPDNVAPALFGQLAVSMQKENKEIFYKLIKPFDKLKCVLFIPEYEVSTADSRGVLPKEMSMSDAVHNSSHLALMVMGFMYGDEELIGKTMDDKIHEPYRKQLIREFDNFKKAALDSGAFSFCLSGAGSTVIAFANEKNAEKVRQSLDRVAKNYNVQGQSIILDPCINGASCQEVQ